MGDENNFFCMKFEATTYFTHHFHFGPLIFNPTLPLKKIQLDTNLSLK